MSTLQRSERPATQNVHIVAGSFGFDAEIQADATIVQALRGKSFPPEGLVDQLERRGLSAKLSVEGCDSGPDCRLEVWASGRVIRVELLAPLPGLLDPPNWHAVRVSGRNRAVWSGPPRSSDVAQICRFLHDLTVLTPSELAGKWQRIG